MNPEIERFLDECRSDLLLKTQPEMIDNLEAELAKLYALGNDNPNVLADWDGISEIVGAKNRTLKQRCVTLVEFIQGLPDT
jgi:hypothetical protein